MKLIGDRIFIKLIQKEQKTKSGLILPTEVIEPEYEVLQVGAKCKGVKQGDKIRLYPHIDLTPYEDGYFMNESYGIKAIL